MVKTILLFVCGLLSFLAMLLVFASATQYGAIFSVIAAADVLVLISLWKLNKTAPQLPWVNGVFLLIVAYTSIDVFLRFLVGIRLLDVLN